MSFSSETLHAIINNKDALVKWLYERYAKKLLAYTLKTYLPNEDDAWSVVYKTLYKMAEILPDREFENEYKLNGFIFKTHINYLRNFLRDNRSFESHNREVELTEYHTAEEEPEKPVSQNNYLTILQQELDKLEDWQRILLLMRGQDVPYSKIAEFVNRPENQLKVYYARLKKQLHDQINEQLMLINTTENAK
ncbi:MAG: sigma-70 family RNA polymerase sigma factor [Bacteroidota bacterium]